MTFPTRVAETVQPGFASTTNGDLVAPLAVEVVDIDREVRPLLLRRADGTPYRGAIVIARHGGRPFGVVSVSADADGHVDGSAVASAVSRIPAPAVAERRVSRPVASPRISVVVATCARPGSVVRCVRSILACDYEDFEVIVVENAPEHSETATAIAENFAGPHAPTYLEEPNVGSSHTRNTGLAWATGEIVAFTDDDVVVDRGWLRAIADAFAPEVGCVTGLIMPLSLENECQVMFERFAAFGKGFARREFSITDQAADHNRLLPYAAGHLGSGANMAFRTDLARELGGFDPVLGLGTSTLGGEDIDLLVAVLLSGNKLVYEPAALIFHEHPATHTGLRRRAFSYGVGLTAMLAKHLWVGPRLRLLATIPAGIGYVFDPASRKNVARGPDYPPALAVLELLGMVIGPLAYLASAARSLSHVANWRPRFLPIRRRLT
jgi:O-antigen biosynthesis protein